MLDPLPCIVEWRLWICARPFQEIFSIIGHYCYICLWCPGWAEQSWIDKSNTGANIVQGQPKGLSPHRLLVPWQHSLSLSDGQALWSKVCSYKTRISTQLQLTLYREYILCIYNFAPNRMERRGKNLVFEYFFMADFGKLWSLFQL